MKKIGHVASLLNLFKVACSIKAGKLNVCDNILSSCMSLLSKRDR